MIKNYMVKKKKYKVTNWREYNNALKTRGSLTFWFSEDFEKGWFATSGDKRQRGHPFAYSNTCWYKRPAIKGTHAKELNPKTDTFEQSSSQGNSTIKRVYNARVVFEFPKRTLKELAEKGMKQWLSERKFNEGRIVSTYPIE